MSGAFQIGAIGLDAQQKALDTIANNISNINTTAFKRTEVRFSEVLATQPAEGVARNDPGASEIAGSGVRSDALYLLNEQGRIDSTGSPTDLAINGAGFIELIGPGGQTLLWRGGALKVGSEGQLMTAAGLELKAGISIPTDAKAIEIGSDGVVRAKTDTDEMVEIGQIMLVKVDDPAAIERMDGGLYRVVDDSRLAEAKPGEDGAGMLIQGSLERSTVELNEEMVKLLIVQRAYAANAQVVQAADQLMGLANGLRR
jgi:flagellar basal-body rod protein FlgG